MTYGSLFSGIGGLDLGLDRAGFTCRWQCEIDDYCRRVLEKHWPGVPRFHDIREINTKELEPVDLICGGWPCQDISIAGAGEGLAGERSGLFYELTRIVGDLLPRYLLLENVSAITFRGLGDVLGKLASLGYCVEWHCLQAADFGAPHIRDRFFLLADSSGVGVERDRPPREPVAPLQIAEELPRRDGPACRAAYWQTEPGMGRMVDGVADWVDRLKGLGNAVLPQITEYFGGQIIAHDRRKKTQ